MFLKEPNNQTLIVLSLFVALIAVNAISINQVDRTEAIQASNSSKKLSLDEDLDLLPSPSFNSQTKLIREKRTFLWLWKKWFGKRRPRPEPEVNRKVRPEPQPEKENKFQIFAKSCAEAHNKYRKDYGAAPLSEDATTKKHAEMRMVKYFTFNSDLNDYDNDPFGELAIVGEIEKFVNRDCLEFLRTNIFDEEEKLYREDKDKFSLETGHFTQAVWKDTKYIACRADHHLLFCAYAPPGNVLDSFQRNVSVRGG